VLVFTGKAAGENALGTSQQTNSMNILTRTAVVFLMAGTLAYGQLIIADNYNVPTAGTGFALNTGVNAGINPPATRLTGSVAEDLRYIQTATGKVATNFTISDGRLQVGASANSGRFTLSADGTTAYNFASALGIASATAANPVVYDVTISMANTLSGTARFSFALGTVESDAGTWDFGVQLYRAATADTFYQIAKRIDTGSSGLAADQNTSIVTTAPGTAGSQLDLRMRVFDAGAETTTFSSRLQLFLGESLVYDTATDASLVNGWRLDGADRYFSWDQAGAGATITGGVSYDNFSVTLVPEPSTAALALLAGLAFFARRRS
jgi:hypothetical protein